MWTPASVEKLELATRSGRLVEKKRFEAKREVGRDRDVAIDVNAMALDGGAVVYDPDREAISIIECGGKPNIPLFTRICRGTGIPFVVVHDSDRKASGRLAAAERVLNALIADTAGGERTIVLDPDFEAVAGLAGHSRRPERAWREFASRASADMPEPLVGVAERAISLARAETMRRSAVARSQSLLPNSSSPL